MIFSSTVHELRMFSLNNVFFADIVDFMKKQVGDPSTLKEKLSDVKNAMLKEDVTIVGFFTGEEDTVYKTYQTACTYSPCNPCRLVLHSLP